ncbi:MAG: hypothetical protein KAR06_05100 [Deltaproteobacteria bacterium]|nr:hypothetical protein [Deltaproteobacteria bacterium]
MNSRILKTLPALFVLLTTFYGCSKPLTDEDVIKNIIKEMATAAEDKKVRRFMSYVADDHADDNGNDRDAIKRVLLYEVMKKDKVKVFLRKTHVEVSGVKALVDLKAVLARGSGEKSIEMILPENSSGYRFNLIFRKVGKDKWQLENASWENIGVSALI